MSFFDQTHPSDFDFSRYAQTPPIAPTPEQKIENLTTAVTALAEVCNILLDIVQEDRARIQVLTESAKIQNAVLEIHNDVLDKLVTYIER